MQNPCRRSLSLLLAVLLATAVAVAPPAGDATAATTIFYNGAGAAPRISVIGDSTIAALRWTGMFEPLKRFNFVYDAESCRRTVLPSCGGREGYAPDTTLQTMRRLSGQLGSALVIMGGYDDPSYGFGSAVDAVMAEAVSQGIPTVMWLTLRANDVAYVGPGAISNSATFRANNRVLYEKAIQYGPRLQIADWAIHSASHPEWFYADGIHFRPAGSNAAASFIADQAGRAIDGEIVTPAAGRARPSAPVGLTGAVGIGVGSGRVRLNWNAPSATGGVPITDYLVQRSYDGGATWVSLSDGVSTNLWFFASGLANGATYRFRVAARNSVGWGPWSNVVSATPRATPPSAPRALTASAGAGQAQLSWVVPSSSGGVPITDYLVQRSYNGGATWVSLSDGVSTNLWFTASGLANGATYQFRVAARNSVGWGPWSNGVSATPHATPPSAPRSLTASAGSGQAQLSWTVPSSSGGVPITDYLVQRSYNGGATWVSLSDGVSTNRWFTASGLANGATYQFRVAARNSVGWGPWSNAVSATPQATLAAPAANDAPTTTATPPPTSSSTTSTTTTSSSSSTTTSTTSPTTSSALESATIGDLVWLDVDGDGLQGQQEPGAAGVVVVLRDESGIELARTVTDQDGAYEFAGVAPGSFVLEVELPENFGITRADEGPDDDLDSELATVDDMRGTAQTDVFAVPVELPDGFDLGLVADPSPSTTAAPTTVPPPTSTEPAATTAVPTTSLPPTTAAPTLPTSTESASTTAAPTTSPPPTSVAPPPTTITGSDGGPGG